MRSEQAIRASLEVALKQMDSIKAEYNKYIDTIYEDRHIQDNCDEWIAIESKINTLLWVLGEVIKG